jgi:hypothetical protein
MLVIFRYGSPLVGALLLLPVLSNTSFFTFFCVLSIFLFSLCISEWVYIATILKTRWQSTLPLIHRYALRFPEESHNLELIRKLTETSIYTYFIASKTINEIYDLFSQSSDTKHPEKDNQRQEILNTIGSIQSTYLKLFSYYIFIFLVFLSMIFLKLEFFG